MKLFVGVILVLYASAEEHKDIRLLDLEPPDAQQLIEKQDTTLKYAPKIESNVPAVRFLGNEPHNVLEDIYLANQYHGQDGLGSYLYGYSVPDIAKTEKKKAGGDLRGAYNYITGNGQEIKVEYWDDGTGFHQIDNVPKVLPTQIDDTPEVKAAREEHFRKWHEEAERNSKPVQTPYNSEGQYASGPLSPQGQLQAQRQYGQPQQFQGQTQQLVNQYQQQKQQYPNPGQPVQYHGEQGLQTQQVSRYQQAGGQYSGAAAGQIPVQVTPAGQPGGYKTAAQYSAGYQAGGQYGGGQASGSYQVGGQQGGGQYSGSQQQAGQYGGDGDYQPGQDEGQWKEEQQEEQGPPRGFFYNFDYPVGIIVQKGQPAPQKRDVKEVYAENKASFEQQLQKGVLEARPSRSASGYLFIKE